MARLLIVEDEAVLRLTFKQFLEEEGHEVWTAADFDEAVARLDDTPIDVIISDIILGGKTGVDLLRTVDEQGLDCMVIMITGNPSVETASQAIRLGAFDYLTKSGMRPGTRRGRPRGRRRSPGSPTPREPAPAYR